MDFPHSTSFFTRLVVEADFDPQLPARVLHRFAGRGVLPEQFRATVIDSETLRVEVEFSEEIEAARLLARRLQNLPSVRSVDLSFRRNAVPSAERTSKRRKIQSSRTDHVETS